MIPVPRLWSGKTVVIVGAGPSLTHADVDRCRDHHLIAIKDAIRLAPWAGVLYGCDRKWWKAHPETESFTGLKYSLEDVRGRPDVSRLRNTGKTGLARDPSSLRTGMNSGYQALGLAVHLGASRIVLLGFDMQPDGEKHRWFGTHKYHGPRPSAPDYRLFLELFPTIVEPLKAAGVEVLNCSRRTALTCFPCVELDEALALGVAA